MSCNICTTLMPCPDCEREEIVETPCCAETGFKCEKCGDVIYG